MMRMLPAWYSMLLCPLLLAAGPSANEPVLSDNTQWVPILLIIVGGLFLAAAVIGPIVRANMPEEVPPPAHSHDEPPGASHHHGKSGTVHPDPESHRHH